MRRTFRHALVLLLSLALSMSGVVIGISHHAVAGPAVGSQEHDHHAAGHAHQDAAEHAAMMGETDDDSHPASTHTGFKCCSMCTFASPLLPMLAENVAFTAFPVAFFGITSFKNGQTIQVDPGIPKRLA